MDHKQLRKEHHQLWELWVKHKFAFGDNPIPQPEKNYIIAIVSDSNRCFVLLEYNDGWIAENGDDRVQDINIPSKEIISYSQKHISENNFIELLLELIQIYSADNNLIVVNRTNGPGRIVFDALRKEVYNLLSLENVRFFPTARRSKYGKDIFPKKKNILLGQGWEMSVAEEKLCFEAMRTAQEQGYFILVADKSKQAFGITSTEEQIDIEPFVFCWMMLSFIRLSTMYLFEE